MITIEIPENGAYTRFPRRSRPTPRPTTGQSLQGAQIAAQRRYNRRTSCSRTEFSLRTEVYISEVYIKEGLKPEYAVSL